MSHVETRFWIWNGAGIGALLTRAVAARAAEVGRWRASVPRRRRAFAALSRERLAAPSPSRLRRARSPSPRNATSGLLAEYLVAWQLKKKTIYRNRFSYLRDRRHWYYYHLKILYSNRIKVEENESSSRHRRRGKVERSIYIFDTITWYFGSVNREVVTKSTVSCGCSIRLENMSRHVFILYFLLVECRLITCIFCTCYKLASAFKC